MVKKVRASQLYKEGRFNVANVEAAPDGTVTIRCTGSKAPHPYSFRARDFLSEREEVLEEDLVEVERD